MKVLYAFALLVATATAAMAEPPKAVNTQAIKDKVSIRLDEVVRVRFKHDGDKLLEPSVMKPSDDRLSDVKIQLGTTSESPVPPPRKGAKRPFLQVTNNLNETVGFRVLIRNKGSKEFFELTEEFQPVAAGDLGMQCWGFDSQIEEVILYNFTQSK